MRKPWVGFHCEPASEMILNSMVKSSASLDRMFSALSDPSRRAMIAQLVLGPASVSELSRPLRMSLPAVVKHLALLEDSGFVVSAKVGRVRTCRINPSQLDAAQSWLADQRATWEARLDQTRTSQVAEDGSIEIG